MRVKATETVREKPSEWTVDRVKAELPDIRVYLLDTRETVTGVVLGRMLPFARVCLPGGQVWEYSWSQLAGALNNGTPLVG